MAQGTQHASSASAEGPFVPQATPDEKPLAEKRDRRFVVLAPVNSPSLDACKLLTSAIALGYPAPIIVNWGLDHRQVSKWERGSHLSKITGGVRYLDAVTRHDAHPGDRLQDDDIVLLVDAHDVWFQLPPDVLLERYHESNARANARLREQWHGGGTMPMRQTIIAATQKRCYPPPEAGSDLHCDKLPESPMRADLYGPNTDRDPEKSEFHDVRPRFLNGGCIMGPAGDMRRLFHRVLGKLHEGIGQGLKMYSDQGIFGEVLGEQEIWRQWQRDHDLENGSDEGMILVQQNLEFHLGLDYHQELSLPTVFGEKDGEIIELENRTKIEKHSAELGISPARLRGVPSDVRQARNPLADLVQEPSDWGELPLYADFFTEAVPVMLHHNAHADGIKQRRVTWWDRTWFFPYLRQLLAVHLTPAELVPLVTVMAEGDSITYWPAESDRTRRKPRLLTDLATEPLAEIEFDEVCRFPDEGPESERHWWDELFRDGKGPIAAHVNLAS